MQILGWGGAQLMDNQGGGGLRRNTGVAIMKERSNKMEPVIENNYSLENKTRGQANKNKKGDFPHR